ncbi:hypothetical protein KOR34_37610 [Posidoniimonas corsicana]|uniref:Putative glutamine amidotransferase domain-containing protein n=1 Tax=Posidoniimonas corsicana TaxID=1938618 RepID=A0A5C5V856_9BACT|nr:glutamine amidotransferase [Posidoniimonas corsicana]TWT33925.1 hypothetical protein KOR34_37610 [Posidoniimonas corsicana]
MTNWGLWGAPEWATGAALLLSIGAAALLYSYFRSPAGLGLRTLAATLKATGLAALAMCLVEPLVTAVRPRPGANLFAIAVDGSQSLQIRDKRGGATRGEQLNQALTPDSAWQTRLGQDFDLRRLVFDDQLRGVKEFATLEFTGESTNMGSALAAIEKRFRGLPLGGVLLFTDGNTTDVVDPAIDLSNLPPVYPVVIGADDVLPDLSVERVSVRQTNFESAPVVIHADIRSSCVDQRRVDVRALDGANQVIEKQTIEFAGDQELGAARFQIRPEQRGVGFLTVRASPADATADSAGGETESLEATQSNNERSVVLDNGKGPYRVLYVAGRPNWDFKFLRRALDDDDQLELVGLVRIAKREAKFTFRRRGSGSGNQLFDGFRRDDEETSERYDEPVLTRLNTRDDEELRDGFPKTADELYQYDAIILDDLEAEFFTQDQLTLLEGFVSRRGGGLLMLAGVESFAEGGYRRTPVADLLPVYLDASSNDRSAVVEDSYRLDLTREGWLQDWVRLRKTEQEERERVVAMPEYKTVSQTGRVKPGAAEMAYVTDVNGEKLPALVAQRFGRGRTAALLIADIWRWGLRRSDIENDDLEKSWRQTVRWLVADVPGRVEVEVTQTSDSTSGVDVQVRVHDAEYLPLDNAEVRIDVASPDGKRLELRAEPSDDEPGVYVTRYRGSTAGPHRATVSVFAPDGSEMPRRQTGWVAQPLAEEFVRLRPNRELLEQIASRTDGQVLELRDLNSFVDELPNRRVPITETQITPLWHQPMFFLLAVTCLVGEWGLRRWKGLA